MAYKLTQAGAEMVGCNEGDLITPRVDKHNLCSEGEKCFSIDCEVEDRYDETDIYHHVALKEDEYIFVPD